MDNRTGMTISDVADKLTGDHGYCKMLDIRRCESIEKLHEAESLTELQNNLNEMTDFPSAPQLTKQFISHGDYIGRWSFGEYGEYRGEWQDSRAHGLGSRWTKRWRYTGTWLDGKQSGVGQYTVLKPSTKGRSVEECEYTGQWDFGSRHGFGVEKDSNGTFAGIWQDGRRGRHGTFYADAGWSYEGTFIKELFGGLGKETFVDGSTYEGEFNIGKRHGVGVKITRPIDAMGMLIPGSSEVRYAGEWQQDRREGYGVELLANGCKYMGEFSRNLHHGWGTLDIRTPDGKTKRYVGKFREGVFDHQKQCKEKKVATSVKKAAQAATDAENAREQSVNFVRISNEKAEAAKKIYDRTLVVVAEFECQWDIFKERKDDNISLETATAFPLRYNAKRETSRVSSKADEVSKISFGDNDSIQSIMNLDEGRSTSTITFRRPFKREENPKPKFMKRTEDEESWKDALRWCIQIAIVVIMAKLLVGEVFS